MKVSEAKEKVCPFIQSGVERGIDNSPMIHGVSIMNTRCICGDCMAWVFTKTHEQIENKAIESDKKSCSIRYSNGAELPEEKKEGICMRLSR